MNTGMLENPITQDNLATLERYGFTVIPSESGVLACKDVGSGRLPKEDVLIEYILHTIARPKDLAGVRVTVTAGPTQEALDPVRYLTNHSTGKMGYALARAAAMRGADVTLIHGETALPPVKFTTDVPVTTAQDLYEAVTGRFDTTDVLIMAAAVADYRPVTVASDTSSCVVFPWRRKILWKTPPPSWQRRIWTWWWPITSRWLGPVLAWTPTWSPSSPRTAPGNCL